MRSVASPKKIKVCAKVDTHVAYCLEKIAKARGISLGQAAEQLVEEKASRLFLNRKGCQHPTTRLLA